MEREEKRITLLVLSFFGIAFSFFTMIRLVVLTRCVEQLHDAGLPPNPVATVYGRLQPVSS